jgi:protein-tyrosine phosphatase
MDNSNLTSLQAMMPSSSRARLCLMLDYPGASRQQIPDPYYGVVTDFEYVLDLLQQACEPLYDRLMRHD